jgi:hypothetical protein
MKPLRNRIRDAALRQKIPQLVIEKDYAISYILAGVTSQTILNETLIFKGGTALKKLFFGDYRFSEDLDFSAKNFSLTSNQLETVLQKAVDETYRLISEYGAFNISLERYVERDPHPKGQEAFTIRVKFPWYPGPLCRIKIEITHDEPVLMKPLKQKLIHGYEESLNVSICCYSLEEIIAEKLRTLLQTHQKLINRGWNRPRARDYYDLWRILTEFKRRLNLKKVSSLLQTKCLHRNVQYQTLNDFFSDELVSEAHKHWDSNLRPFVNDLPECQNVLDQLRILLNEIVNTP